MIEKKLELINEQTSPLFRIMWVYNIDEPGRKQFGNNICAFHAGNGNIMSVAHNLRSEAGMFHSMSEEVFNTHLLPRLNAEQQQIFNLHFVYDFKTQKRYINPANTSVNQIIADILKQINFDTRWVTLNQLNICKPFLIVQFRNNLFYDNNSLTNHFNVGTFFHEPTLNRHTFLIELELVQAHYADDVALYRIVNTEPDVINRLPSIRINFSVLDDQEKNLFCLQSSTNSLLGRLANKAIIEGYADNWSLYKDRIGGDYIMEGIRYLIKGYFRFGSSGAPYVVYDEDKKEFFANAVQSEASPIQLSINRSREGNFQYVNAIATPLNNLRNELDTIIS